MKIIIQGPKKSGKTTLLNKIIKKNMFKTYGIKTKKTKTGITISYIINNKCIQWKKCGRFINGKMTSIPETFDKFGTEIIKKLLKLKSSFQIIIDEIGFAELESEIFCKYIIKLASVKKNIIMILRNEKNKLIDSIKKINSFNIIYLTKKNRHSLLQL